MSTSFGGQLDLALAGVPAHAHELAFVLGSASGTSPGLPTAAGLLPLEVDAYFLYALANPNQGWLQGTLGLLDGLGKRYASIALPASAGSRLAGLSVHHAWVALVPATLQATLGSNAPPLELVP